MLDCVNRDGMRIFLDGYDSLHPQQVHAAQTRQHVEPRGKASAGNGFFMPQRKRADVGIVAVDVLGVGVFVRVIKCRDVGIFAQPLFDVPAFGRGIPDCAAKQDFAGVVTATRDSPRRGTQYNVGRGTWKTATPKRGTRESVSKITSTRNEGNH